jgi:hypothetical protein
MALLTEFEAVSEERSHSGVETVLPEVKKKRGYGLP